MKLPASLRSGCWDRQGNELRTSIHASVPSGTPLPQLGQGDEAGAALAFTWGIPAQSYGGRYGLKQQLPAACGGLTTRCIIDEEAQRAVPAWHFRATNEASLVLPAAAHRPPRASGSVITEQNHLRTGAAHPTPLLGTGSIQEREG